MTIVYLLLILILATLFYFIYRQSRIKQIEPDLSKAIDTLVKLSNEKLDDKSKQISIDLTNKKDAIEKMVKDIGDSLSKVEKERIGSFNQLREVVENNSKITKELSVTTDGLKRTLSSDRMRGAFGEKVAEDLLKQSGFVIGTNYSKQETFEQGRPDFTIFLPDKTKINVDAKFPYANIVKMSETDNADQKAQFLKAFEGDIKRKIIDVSTRNYINPEENTVDFVVVFIPNEMIFSFIYEKFPNILEEAFSKKIIFAGPFSFVAILRMVNQ
jgi:DNA recombination protein RmuC